MSDLVQRLRSRAWEDRQHRQLRAQAADAIERLTHDLNLMKGHNQTMQQDRDWARAEVERLRAALDTVASYKGENDAARQMAYIAQAALEGSASTSVLRPGPGATVDDHGRVQWTTRDLLKAFAGTQEPHCATCQCYPSTSAESSGVKGSGDEERDSDSAPTSNAKPLQIGDPCPTCSTGKIGQNGDNYRCGNCGWLGPSIR